MKHPVKKWGLVLSLCVLAQGLAASAKADVTFTLAQLLGPNGVDVTIGDKIFYDFDFTSVAFDVNGNLIAGADPTKIGVTFKDPVNGVYNVVVQSASQFVAQNGGSGEQDSKLSFFVSTTSGQPLITGVDLERGGVSGGGTLDIIEAVAFNGPPPGATTLHVFGPGGPLTDFANITPSSTLFVSAR